MNIDLEKFKLCYVCHRDGFAYFTEIELGDQWGDDWNDAPYEHNAGDPYETHKDGTERVPHRILKIAWDGPYETPAVLGGPNSAWSVEAINRGSIAWFIPTSWGVAPCADVRPIHAGCSVLEFIEKIELSGGCVYMPRVVWDSLTHVGRKES
jgi:hypothetical protein